MRRLIVAVGVALLASTAAAADLPAYEPASVIAPGPAAYDWSGFYIGANGGYGWGDSTFTYRDVGTSSTTSFDGALFGGQIGYNFQVGGGFLVGLEGDFDWSGIDGSDACRNPAFDCKVDLNWLASARGRVGYAFDRFLVYGTGGVGFGDVDFDTSPATTPALQGASDTMVGWVAGGGVEFGIGRHWSVKAEYDHFDLGDTNTRVGDLSNLSRTELDFQVDTVRAGVNYRF
jgi:outer membrane immunogenic protein